MSHRSYNVRRVLLSLTVLLSLSLPLAAQADPNRQDLKAERFLALVWERLTAPFTALWAGAPDASDPASPGTGDPASTTDGRSVIDPLG
jgi:hypothetical protein